MARTVAEWVGKSPDTPAPPRVRLRVLEAFDCRCACGCGWLILPWDKWHLDHKIALINGGENRESNLQPLLDIHHKVKTLLDLREKTIVYRKKLKHFGIRKKPKRPMLGSKASGFKKKLDGTVERR